MNPDQPPAYPTRPYSVGQINLSNSATQKNRRRLFVVGSIILILILIAGLLSSGLFAGDKLKTITYDNNRGQKYSLQFFAKRSEKLLDSGTRQLTAKVSRDNKFPINLSITTIDAVEAGPVRNCNGFAKVFEVKNDHFNQTLAVCDFTDTAGSVYVAGIPDANIVHLVTFGQDYGSINLSSRAQAQAALPRFGLQPYEADIKTILQSVKKL